MIRRFDDLTLGLGVVKSRRATDGFTPPLEALRSDRLREMQRLFMAKKAFLIGDKGEPLRPMVE